MRLNRGVDWARYFDNAATTPLDPRVREAMLPFLADEFGNASSIHSWGLRAHDAVEQARAQVAELIGAEDPLQIFFTSGATEANNWVLNAAEEIWISPFEHSAMREPALARAARILPNDGTALPNTQHPTPNTLLSVMSVNNEIGAIWDVRELFAGTSPLLHSDITQAVGKLPINVAATLGRDASDTAALDFASFSAHKFYGPKGIGALYCKDQPPAPLVRGGEQEHGARGGTLNVAGIVGMGEAAEIAREEQADDYPKAAELRGIVLAELDRLSDWSVNPDPRPPTPEIQNPKSKIQNRQSPFILSLSFLDLQGETIVLEMDRAGYAISAGAACSSRSTEPSHVLTALNLQPAWLRGTIRVSFGRFNTKDETAIFAKMLRTTVENLRTL